MKRLAVLVCGLFSIYLGFYGLTAPFEKSKIVIEPILPAQSYPNESQVKPSEAPISHQNLVQPTETIEPTPSPFPPVVEPQKPVVADLAQQVANQYYTTNATLKAVPNGFGGWHLRRDPCMAKGCLYPHQPLVPVGYRVKVLDYPGLLDNLDNEWVKVRVFWLNGEDVGYIHSSGIVYD